MGGRRSTASQRTGKEVTLTAAIILEDLVTSWEAGEAQFHSAHTRRSLPQLLSGKSPCRRAESATRRLRIVGNDTSNEASGGAAVASRFLLHQHGHAVSAHLRAPTERGSLSPCLLSRQITHLLLLIWHVSFSQIAIDKVLKH